MMKIRSLHLPKSTKRTRGQSFLELALVLPILLLMLLGVIEVAIYIGHYLDALDLTREAARFASIRDPFADTERDHDCFDSNYFDFYWDTSCIFSPPEPAECPPAKAINLSAVDQKLWWCNGLNKYLDFDPATDDIVISLYTVDGSGAISQTHPVGSESLTDAGGLTSYYWALSNHIDNGTYTAVDNWKKDCEGNVDNTKLPFYTRTSTAQMMHLNPGDYPGSVTVTPAPGAKGFAAVEIYYCHKQALGLPVFTLFVPNPMMIHAYTIMPLPAAAPTPTAKP